MTDPYRYPQDSHVAFDNGYMKGTGRVIGVATVGAPIIGQSYIIEVEESNIPIPNEAYPFKAICIFEVHMRLAAPYPQPQTDENGVLLSIKDKQNG